ncbi:MAG: pro-sigmaK processing inhibitor BofA family protein [Methanomicrobiales archaeon]
MLGTILTILFALAVAGAIFYFFKQATKLIVNAVLGLATLFFVNIFSVMSWFGAPDVEITLVSLIICAFGGVPGAVVLIILHLFGITI